MSASLPEASASRLAASRGSERFTGREDVVGWVRSWGKDTDTDTNVGTGAGADGMQMQMRMRMRVRVRVRIRETYKLAEYIQTGSARLPPSGSMRTCKEE